MKSDERELSLSWKSASSVDERILGSWLTRCKRNEEGIGVRREFKVTEIKMWWSSGGLSERIESQCNEMARDKWELVEMISSVGMWEFPNYVRLVWSRAME